MHQRFFSFRSIFKFRRHNKFLRQNNYVRTSYHILDNMFFDFTNANNCIVSKENAIIVSCQMTSLKKWKKNEKKNLEHHWIKSSFFFFFQKLFSNSFKQLSFSIFSRIWFDSWNRYRRRISNFRFESWRQIVKSRAFFDVVLNFQWLLWSLISNRNKCCCTRNKFRRCDFHISKRWKSVLFKRWSR